MNKRQYAKQERLNNELKDIIQEQKNANKKFIKTSRSIMGIHNAHTVRRES